MERETFLRLPFEVHYKSIAYTGYEELVRSGEPKKTAGKKKDRKIAIEITRGRSFDAVFRCDSTENGELAYVFSGNLELIPEWMNLVSDRELSINHSSRHPLLIDEHEVIEMPLGDADEYEVTGKSIAYYDNEDSEIDCFVLDADGSRIKINTDGYRLKEDGRPTGSKPFFTLKDEDTDDCPLVSREWYDVAGELAAFFK